MAIQKTEKIWHNGKFIPWDDATLHVMSHVVNYGSSVFEGIRCYALPSGPAIFRAQEHMQRLLDSARIYRIDVDFTRDELTQGLVELIKNNGVWPCYIRPIILRGYGEAGVNPQSFTPGRFLSPARAAPPRARAHRPRRPRPLERRRDHRRDQQPARRPRRRRLPRARHAARAADRRTNTRRRHLELVRAAATKAV